MNARKHDRTSIRPIVFDDQCDESVLNRLNKAKIIVRKWKQLGRHRRFVKCYVSEICQLTLNVKVKAPSIFTYFVFL